MPTTILLFLLTTCFRLQVFSEEAFTQVVLHIGESVDLDGGRLSVNLEEVISDSRCPRGYKCITAGEDVRILALETGVHRSVPGQVSTVRPLSVQMTALDPYPEDHHNCIVYLFCMRK
jgi:hypothetical protein